MNLKFKFKREDDIVLFKFELNRKSNSPSSSMCTVLQDSSVRLRDECRDVEILFRRDEHK